jgi:aminopeptidase N
MSRARWSALAVVVVVLAGAGGVVALDQDDGAGSSPSASSPTSTVPGSSTTATGTVGAEGVGDPYFPNLGNGGYDVGHYDLALSWHADAGTLDGVATIAATATQDLTRFDLDLSGLEVRSVEVDGRAATFTRHDRELVITPASELDEGTRFTTVVAYDGSPTPVSEGTDLFDVGWQTDGREAFVVSEPSGAQTFYPSNDHPTDKATYSFHVTAPSDQTVAANGLLQGTHSGAGVTTWDYEARDPIASYLVQIAVGDYELVDGGTVDGIVVRHAIHRSLLAEGKATLARTGEMLQLLEQIWGPYPFEAYGVLVVDEPLGFALETQTLTLVGSDIGTGGRSVDDILLHEMSHQWVGDSVSLASWKDIWLNEGFATYSEWLWSERTGGPSAAVQARGRFGPLDVPPADPGNEELFGDAVYQRGGRTLQALREEVGDDAFFRILRAWPQDHHFANASTTDFQALAERVSGQDLDDLFQRWLYQPDEPSLGPPPTTAPPV